MPPEPTLTELIDAIRNRDYGGTGLFKFLPLLLELEERELAEARELERAKLETNALEFRHNVTHTR
jgi:hypothetical protein